MKELNDNVKSNMGGYKDKTQFLTILTSKIILLERTKNFCMKSSRQFVIVKVINCIKNIKLRVKMM